MVQKNRLAIVDAITRGVVDVGELRISKTTLGKRGGERFLIYLPLNRNYLWRELYERRVKVRIFIEIPVEAISGGKG
ncbi:MAG: hypothetical protein LM564_00905 [Desulfurococcaceae archaeon]|nr:hypothetical protein [Desulfurococcaceae archaeon]